ncbi:hypothetical protein GCM10017778_44180 [Streptomyces vinaceus]|nr:hypothetical protein GCM10017778_44180 [Streptomyces vinaceus]
MATAYGSSAESKSRRSRLPSTIAAISSRETTTPASVARAVTDGPAGGRVPVSGGAAGRGGADGGWGGGGGGGGSAARASEGSDTAPR